jgi:hypothetical protein
MFLDQEQKKTKKINAPLWRCIAHFTKCLDMVGPGTYVHQCLLQSIFFASRQGAIRFIAKTIHQNWQWWMPSLVTTKVEICVSFSITALLYVSRSQPGQLTHKFHLSMTTTRNKCGSGIGWIANTFEKTQHIWEDNPRGSISRLLAYWPEMVWVVHSHYFGKVHTMNMFWKSRNPGKYKIQLDKRWHIKEICYDGHDDMCVSDVSRYCPFTTHNQQPTTNHLSLLYGSIGIQLAAVLKQQLISKVMYFSR